MTTLHAQPDGRFIKLLKGFISGPTRNDDKQAVIAKVLWTIAVQQLCVHRSKHLPAQNLLFR
jgi:hypothetical protein